MRKLLAFAAIALAAACTTNERRLDQQVLVGRVVSERTVISHVLDHPVISEEYWRVVTFLPEGPNLEAVQFVARSSDCPPANRIAALYKVKLERQFYPSAKEAGLAEWAVISCSVVSARSPR